MHNLGPREYAGLVVMVAIAIAGTTYWTVFWLARSRQWPDDFKRQVEKKWVGGIGAACIIAAAAAIHIAREWV